MNVNGEEGVLGWRVKSWCCCSRWQFQFSGTKRSLSSPCAWPCSRAGAAQPVLHSQAVKSGNHGMVWAAGDPKLGRFALDQVAQMCLFIFWGLFCSGLFLQPPAGAALRYLAQFLTQDHAVVALPRVKYNHDSDGGALQTYFYDNGMWNRELHWPGQKKKGSWKWHEREQCPTLLTPPVQAAMPKVRRFNSSGLMCQLKPSAQRYSTTDTFSLSLSQLFYSP